MDWDSRLRELGQRSTPARRAVLEVLDATSAHLSADEIAIAVAQRAPEVHRATVFRTLDRLTTLGVVTHVHLPHGAATYHVAEPQSRLHLHLACRGCGGVFDTEATLLDDVAAELASTSGFVLDADHTALSGWCSECERSGGPDGGG